MRFAAAASTVAVSFALPIVAFAASSSGWKVEGLTNRLPAVKSTEHIQGSAKAEVTIIEYADFECPFCKRHQATMKQILRKYPGKVRWVYRHMPLSFHPNALPSAIASECAAKLGGNAAFWKMQEKLMASTTYDFTAMAKTLKLPEAKFKACLNDITIRKRIESDTNVANGLPIYGTPTTFIVNEKRNTVTMISGAVPLENFTDVIAKIVKK